MDQALPDLAHGGLVRRRSGGARRGAGPQALCALSASVKKLPAVRARASSGVTKLLKGFTELSADVASPPYKEGQRVQAGRGVSRTKPAWCGLALKRRRCCKAARFGTGDAVRASGQPQQLPTGSSPRGSRCLSLLSAPHERCRGSPRAPPPRRPGRRRRRGLDERRAGSPSTVDDGRRRRGRRDGNRPQGLTRGGRQALS